MKDTKDKIQEAEFFLEQAKGVNPFSDDLRWYLSAFLTAARSIKDFLHAEYSKSAHFRSWEVESKKSFEKDGLVEYFDKHRQLVVHQRALKCADSINEGNGGVTLSISGTGSTVAIVRVLELSGETFVQFEDNRDKPALELCADYLKKMKDNALEWEKKLNEQPNP